MGAGPLDDVVLVVAFRTMSMSSRYSAAVKVSPGGAGASVRDRIVDDPLQLGRCELAAATVRVDGSRIGGSQPCQDVGCWRDEIRPPRVQRNKAIAPARAAGEAVGGHDAGAPRAPARCIQERERPRRQTTPPRRPAPGPHDRWRLAAPMQPTTADPLSQRSGQKTSAARVQARQASAGGRSRRTGARRGCEHDGTHTHESRRMSLHTVGGQTARAVRRPSHLPTETASSATIIDRSAAWWLSTARRPRRL